jgi:metallo-beta-lactamase class B
MRTIFTILILLLSFANIFAQTKQSRLKISHLTGDFYVYETFNDYKGTLIPANGMYMVTNDGVLMIDTPWDTTQFQPLLDSIKAKHKKNLTMCISTHFHEDRTGGLEYYKQQGIKTYTTKKTDELSKKRNMKRAEFLLNKDTLFTLGQYSFQTYYPGEGHAPDNIVVWFEKEKVLYGGCLIKSAKDTSLGNLGDANVKEYASTLENVKRKCKKPIHIIPGHNDWTSTSSLNHTLKMAQELKQKK